MLRLLGRERAGGYERKEAERVLVILKSPDEIKIMREAGRHVAEVLQILADAVRPGALVSDLDDIVRDEYERRGITPTFLGYPPGADTPFPARVCVSINEQIVHGIPRRRPMCDGDVVSIDLGATYRGFVGDAAITVGCGRISPEAARLIEATRRSLDLGIEQARAGNYVGDIGHAVQSYAEQFGYGLVRQYVGHGVGRNMHEEPQVPNHGKPRTGKRLKAGMVIAIEPMLNLGTHETEVLPDEWTIVTKDGSISAHFEHTIAVTPNGPQVLTLP